MGTHSCRSSGTPARVDALTASSDGWLLSDDRQLWHSTDGTTWNPVADSRPALFLLTTPDGTWAAGEDGLARLI